MRLNKLQSQILEILSKQKCKIQILKMTRSDLVKRLSNKITSSHVFCCLYCVVNTFALTDIFLHMTTSSSYHLQHSVKLALSSPHLDTSWDQDGRQGPDFPNPQSIFSHSSKPFPQDSNRDLWQSSNSPKNILSSANLANLATIKTGCMLGPLFASTN